MNLLARLALARRSLAASLALSVCLCAGAVAGQDFTFDIDGFTEPFRTISVATAETGILMSIDVRPGATVEKGQVIARLDDEVHQALLKIAAKGMEARGRLESAQAERRLRRQRLEKLEELDKRGHARPEEVERARADLAIAEAQVTAAEEELLIKRLEYDKIMAQLERRKIRAPAAGVITTVMKEVGEIVAPNDAQVFTLVQLDPLLASFSIPLSQAVELKFDQTVHVRFLRNDRRVAGKVDLISPVIDAESETVRVKVRIDNPQGKILSGERCLLDPRRIQPARRGG